MRGSHVVKFIMGRGRGTSRSHSSGVVDGSPWMWGAGYMSRNVLREWETKGNHCDKAGQATGIVIKQTTDVARQEQVHYNSSR